MTDQKGNDVLDAVLNKISLAFGADSLEVLFPEDMLVDLSVYRISKIDTNDLEGELIFQSKIYMLFVTILSYVTDKYARTDAYCEQLESKLTLGYEKQLIANGDRVSDKKLEKLVDSDDKYIEMINQKLHYKGMMVTFSNIVTGLENKRDMLLQLSAKRRAEMGKGVV